MDRYIQAHGRRLFGLCLTLCAHRQDAEDLYQDTWLKALACLGYVCLSAAGGGLAALVCPKERRLAE